MIFFALQQSCFCLLFFIFTYKNLPTVVCTKGFSKFDHILFKHNKIYKVWERDTLYRNATPVSVTSLVTCSDAFFTVVRTEMEIGWVSGGNTWALTRPPWRGLKFCRILDRRWLYVPASCNPLCDYPVQLKILCWKQAAEHRGLQKDKSVWVLLLTTRTALSPT